MLRDGRARVTQGADAGSGPERMRAWVESLDPAMRRALYLLLAELCAGLDVSRHNEFGFLRLRAEFETSGEIFGCSLEELRDAMGASLPDDARRIERPPSALEALRDRIRGAGHPDFG